MPNAIILYNSLALILGIILHDVIQKIIKLFYFSRFKPSSLQFTVFQLLSPILDSLLVIVSFVGLIRQLISRVTSDQEYSKGKLWRNAKMSAFVVGAVPFLIPDEETEEAETSSKSSMKSSKSRLSVAANGEKLKPKLTKNQLRVSESE